MAELKRRFALYFRDAAPGVPVDSAEGQRLMLANAAAMNYGFAFRVATYAGLTDIARRTFGLRASSLVVDSPHNSIYEEDVEGRAAIVHRHISAAQPEAVRSGRHAFGEVGKAVLVPGLALNVLPVWALLGAQGRSPVSTRPYGAGTVIDRFEQGSRPGRTRSDRVDPALPV